MKGGGQKIERDFAVRCLQQWRIDYGDAGLCEQKHKAILEQEGPVMAQKVQRADSAAFHCAGGVIGWVNLAKRAYAKLTGLAGGYEMSEKQYESI